MMVMARRQAMMEVFQDIAHGMGLAGKRVTQPGDIQSAVTEALTLGNPYVLEAVTEGRMPAP